MPSNLPADRLRVRRKPCRRHHSRMEIAIRTLRLTKRYLNVDPQACHRFKTLAYPHPTRSGAACVEHFAGARLPDFRLLSSARNDLHWPRSRILLWVAPKRMELTV